MLSNKRFFFFFCFHMAFMKKRNLVHDTGREEEIALRKKQTREQKETKKGKRGRTEEKRNLQELSLMRNEQALFKSSMFDR